MGLHQPDDSRSDQEQFGEGETLVACNRDYKDARQRLVVSVDEYEGKRYVSIREWFVGNDGQWRPGKKGITVRAKELDAVTRALGQAKGRL